MSLVGVWLRLDLRRRWRSLVVLTLLIAIAGTVVLAALAGARRGASAITRLEGRTLPATAMVLPNQPGFDWNKVRALPEVAAVGTFVVDYTLTVDGLSGDNLGFPPADDAFMRTLERPVILAGRAVNPAAPDEALVSPRFLRDHHKRIGDTLTFRLPTPKQLQAQAGDHLTGPVVQVRIVGAGVTPWLVDGPGSTGGVQISAGLVARYPANTIGNQQNPSNTNYINALVRLRGGEADLPKFRADLAALTGRNDIDVVSAAAQARNEQRTAAFEARCLVAFAVAALLAALFLVGQAIARYAASSTVELQTLRALGMTPRQAVVTATASPLLAGVVGAVLATLAAWVASSRFPIGLARPVESAPGRHADWIVLAPGLILIPALVCAAATAAAALALAATRREAGHRRSAVATALARAGLPTPLVVGARFALESGRGKSAVPVRPALIGAFTGVLGVLAAFTFSHGVNDAAKHPERFGQTFQLDAFVGINGQDFGPVQTVLDGLRQNSDVTGVDDAATAVATGPRGGDSISLWQYTTGSKPMPTVLTSGRMAAGPGEVVLAPQTLSALHAKVGETVPLTGTKGTVALTVTGVGFVPQGPHNGYADGGWIAPAAYQRLFGTDFKFHIVLITLRPGARGPHAAAAIGASLKKLSPKLADLQLGRPDPIDEISQLRDVRTLPIALGAFLALLAVGAIGHALGTAVRRRSHDLAVLRALGMTRAQCRWVVFTQATVLCIVGLLFGVPVGLALGRGLWRAVADFTPLQYVPPLAVWALLLVAPAALLAANLLAAWPGRRAAGLRIAQVLRAE